jgi:pimeloyl-ACP methyl ester carboxylesterase
MKSLKVILTTSDEVELAGDYIPGSLPFGVIMLHMMPATKESFSSFAEELSSTGYHTLAIDMRGHGESAGGNYQDFTDEDHQKSLLDIKAAAGYLKKQNPEMKIGLIGASIGANLAMLYSVAEPLAFAVLLSPGLNYRGIDGLKAAAVMPADLPVYFLAALDDERVEGNSRQTETLFNACGSKSKHIQVLRSGGHGTGMIEGDPSFRESLIQWIQQSAK